MQPLIIVGTDYETIPEIEEDITVIRCIYNEGLTRLPKLPNGLTILHCYRNQLTELPTLPERLDTLWCDTNPLKTLPTLPNSITWLDCHDNQLTELPTLPINLTSLICHNNNLTVIPTIPNTLKVIGCERNQLYELPVLPNTIIIVRCGNNKLTQVDSLPSNIIEFDCTNNMLTTLPILPDTLRYLRCSGNPFKQPFKRWVDEYDEEASIADNTIPVDLLRKRVNTYWTTWIYARDLKNLLVTVGQREQQAQMGNPRDESEDRVQDCLNADCLSVIASFLTGQKGSVMQQKRKLYELGTF